MEASCSRCAVTAGGKAERSESVSAASRTAPGLLSISESRTCSLAAASPAKLAPRRPRSEGAAPRYGPIASSRVCVHESACAPAEAVVVGAVVVGAVVVGAVVVGAVVVGAVVVGAVVVGAVVVGVVV